MNQGVTAEWICTRCESTNRRLVAGPPREVRDRCVSCRLTHTIAPNSRPVRWTARPA